MSRFNALIAMIDRDESIFAIDADELGALAGAGVSEPVILAMLHRGRDVPLELAPTPPVKGIFFTGPQPSGLLFDGSLSGSLFVPARLAPCPSAGADPIEHFAIDTPRHRERE